LDYLNGIEFEEQVHGFERKSSEIDMVMVGTRGFESVEGGFDGSKVFELG